MRLFLSVVDLPKIFPISQRRIAKPFEEYLLGKERKRKKFKILIYIKRVMTGAEAQA